MASVNLNKENNLDIAMSTDAPINAQVQNIDYLPSYKVAEEERRANELGRMANETARETYFEGMVAKFESGYFKGDKGEPGATGYDGKSLEYNWNGTELGVRVEGETEYAYSDLKGIQGEKGEKGDPGEMQDLTPYATKEYVNEAITGALGGSY